MLKVYMFNIHLTRGIHLIVNYYFYSYQFHQNNVLLFQNKLLLPKEKQTHKQTKTLIRTQQIPAHTYTHNFETSYMPHRQSGI